MVSGGLAASFVGSADQQVLRTQSAIVRHSLAVSFGAKAVCALCSARNAVARLGVTVSVSVTLPQYRRSNRLQPCACNRLCYGLCGRRLGELSDDHILGNLMKSEQKR